MHLARSHPTAVSEKRLPEFVKTIVSKNVPFDKGKLSGEAKRGLKLFKGKAGCIGCHSGPMFSDGQPHNTGVPENPKSSRIRKDM